MDNFDSGNLGNQNLNNPIPLDSGPDTPSPLGNAGASETGVSHSPLDLGSSRAVEIPKVDVPKQVTKKSTEKVLSTERIVGVKTFFTKLHPGALNFLDEQITKWLTENPDISIKLTNVAVGEIQAKKTEPNILITVWY